MARSIKKILTACSLLILTACAQTPPPTPPMIGWSLLFTQKQEGYSVDNPKIEFSCQARDGALVQKQEPISASVFDQAGHALTLDGFSFQAPVDLQGNQFITYTATCSLPNRLNKNTGKPISETQTIKVWVGTPQSIEATPGMARTRIMTGDMILASFTVFDASSAKNAISAETLQNHFNLTPSLLLSGQSGEQSIALSTETTSNNTLDFSLVPVKGQREAPDTYSWALNIGSLTLKSTTNTELTISRHPYTEASFILLYQGKVIIPEGNTPLPVQQEDDSVSIVSNIPTQYEVQCQFSDGFQNNSPVNPEDGKFSLSIPSGIRVNNTIFSTSHANQDQTFTLVCEDEEARALRNFTFTPGPAEKISIQGHKNQSICAYGSQKKESRTFTVSVEDAFGNAIQDESEGDLKNHLLFKTDLSQTPILYDLEGNTLRIAPLDSRAKMLWASWETMGTTQALETSTHCSDSTTCGPWTIYQYSTPPSVRISIENLDTNASAKLHQSNSFYGDLNFIATPTPTETVNKDSIQVFINDSIFPLTKSSELRFQAPYDEANWGYNTYQISFEDRCGTNFNTLASDSPISFLWSGKTQSEGYFSADGLNWEAIDDGVQFAMPVSSTSSTLTLLNEQVAPLMAQSLENATELGKKTSNSCTAQSCKFDSIIGETKYAPFSLENVTFNIESIALGASPTLSFQVQNSNPDYPLLLSITLPFEALSSAEGTNGRAKFKNSENPRISFSWDIDQTSRLSGTAKVQIALSPMKNLPPKVLLSEQEITIDSITLISDLLYSLGICENPKTHQRSAECIKSENSLKEPGGCYGPNSWADNSKNYPNVKEGKPQTNIVDQTQATLCLSWAQQSREAIAQSLESGLQSYFTRKSGQTSGDAELERFFNDVLGISRNQTTLVVPWDTTLSTTLQASDPKISTSNASFRSQLLARAQMTIARPSNAQENILGPVKNSQKNSSLSITSSESKAKALWGIQTNVLNQIFYNLIPAFTLSNPSTVNALIQSGKNSDPNALFNNVQADILSASLAASSPLIVSAKSQPKGKDKKIAFSIANLSYGMKRNSSQSGIASLTLYGDLSINSSDHLVFTPSYYQGTLSTQNTETTPFDVKAYLAAILNGQINELLSATNVSALALPSFDAFSFSSQSQSMTNNLIQFSGNMN